MKTLKGRTINEGYVEGTALVSPNPISFYGGVDMKTGYIIEKGHPLENECIKDKILVFELIKGSTVTPYIIYGLARYKVAPKAIVCNYAEALLTIGVILANIPCIDQIEINEIETGDFLKVDGERGVVLLEKIVGP